MKEDLHKTPKLKDSVLSEALILRRLRHANLIAIEEIHEDATSLYFMYKLTGGGDLFEDFRNHKLAKNPYTEDEGMS